MRLARSRRAAYKVHMLQTTEQTAGSHPPAHRPIEDIVRQVREPVSILRLPTGEVRAALGVIPSQPANGVAAVETVAVVPGFYPEWLGDRSFGETHRVRFPYVIGAMANGITSVDLTVAGARAGILTFYGAAGLGIDRIKRDVAQIQKALGPHAPT